MVKFVITYLLLLVAPYTIQAAQLSVRVSKDVVAIGERFQLIVTVQLQDNEKADIPELPKTIAPFSVLGSHTSSQVSYTLFQGQSSKSIEKVFSYTLSSQKEGVWKIDPITVEINGSSHQTKLISVEVSSKIKKPQTPHQPSHPPGLFNMFDIFDDPSFFPSPKKRGSLKDSFQFKAKLNHRNVYVGEMVPIQWYLYKKPNTSHRVLVENIDSIQPEGFWIEKLQDTSRLSFDQTETIDRQLYRRALLLSYGLFPLKTGVLKIPPIGVQLATQHFSMFSSDSFRLSSQPISIQVIPLPEKGKGQFTGAVGQFVVTNEFSHKNTFTDDILSYKIHFRGSGNIKNIQLPPWPKSSDFKIYDVLESQQFSANNSYKTYELLLLPKKSGLLSTPELKWTTFDPELKSYVNHQLSSFQVNVKISQTEKQKSEKFFTESEDLGLSKKQSALNFPILTKEVSFYHQYDQWIWGLFYLLLILLIIWKRQVWLFRFRRKKDISKIVKDQLELAYLKAKKNEYQRVGMILLSLVDQVWLVLTGTSGREMSVLLEKCSPSIQKELSIDLKNFIQKLEVLSFAPKEMNQWSQKDILQLIQTGQLLIQKVLQHYPVSSSRTLSDNV